MLFTAQAYADRNPWVDPITASVRLAPLIRCPHLSQFWLSASVLSNEPHKVLLRKLQHVGLAQSQLQQLLLRKFRSANPRGELRPEQIANVPASWLLPVRDIQLVSSVNLTWELDVCAIRTAALYSGSRKQKAIKRSPVSSLIGGVRWGMKMYCDWDASKQGSTINLYACAESLLAGTACRCTYTLKYIATDKCGVKTAEGSRKEANHFEADEPWGWEDVFGVGVMSGGFDEAAWAAKGLPAEGSIALHLTVEDVGM